MWESLGTTHRQDRVLHGAAKALNVAVGLVALPLWLFGQRLREPFRRLLARLDGEPAPLPVAPAARALDGRADGRPRGDPAPAAPLRRRRWRARGSPTSRPSCSPTSARRPTSATPTRRSSRITCSRGPTASGSPPRSGSRRPRARPGLIVVHGLFSSRRFDYVRQIAVRAYYEWGFNVLALDLRSFGLTNLTSQAPTTVGWKEGEDIVAAGALSEAARGDARSARWGSRSAASAVLGACHARGRRARPWTAASSRSRRPPTRGRWRSGSPCACLAPTPPTSSTSASGRCSPRGSARRGWEGIEDFVDPVEQVSAPYYGVERGRALAAGRRQAAHRRRQGAGAGPAPRGRRDHSRGAREDARRRGARPRAGAGLDPAGRGPRGDRRGRSRPGSTPSCAVSSSGGPGTGGRDGATRERRALGPLAVQADLLRREVTEVENDIVRRLLWSGWWPGISALATVAANRVAAVIWIRVFGEEPPE